MVMEQIHFYLTLIKPPNIFSDSKYNGRFEYFTDTL